MDVSSALHGDGPIDGALAEALGVDNQLTDCPRDELGVSPSPATRHLYERLLAET